MWGWVFALVFALYLVPHVLVSLLPSQNLKKKARQRACEESSPKLVDH